MSPPAFAANCDNTSVGTKPLTELGSGTYEGKQGGLYPGATNKRPPAHTAKGLDLAKHHVIPRTADGKPDPKNGKLAFLSVGMSNAEQEFRQFIHSASADPLKSRRVVVVNGAQAGREAGEVARGSRGYWEEVDARLAEAGVTQAQVGAIWLKETDGKPRLPFEPYIAKLEEDLATIVQIAKDRFPNMWIVYVSTRVYGGYASTEVSPEPWAYQDGFAAKGLIERQLTGQLPVGSDSAPWLSWGPYMWADGIRARADGLRWVCSDFQPDGVHPSRVGTEKVADLLLGFLHKDVTAKTWYTGAAQSPAGSDPPEASATPAPSNAPTPESSVTPTTSPGQALPAASTDQGLPSSALLLLAAPAVALVVYRLLRGHSLIPRLRRGPGL